MAKQIIGSKIGGVFSNLSFDSETNGLVFKNADGSEVEIVGGGNGGSTIKMIQLVRPISDEAILPKIEISADETFSNILHTIDASLASDRSKFMVYAEDSGWMSLNTDLVGRYGDNAPDGIHDFAYGLGTPFDNAIVLCDLSGVEAEEPYFIRWCWQTIDENGDVVTTIIDGVPSNVTTGWQSTQFPTSPAFVPNTPNQDGSLKTVALTQTQYDAIEIHDDNTLYVIID